MLALIALGAVLALARRPNAPAPRRFALAITVLVPALITAGQTADERPRSARPAGMAVMILLVLGLQTLGDIGINQNSTVVLRVPVDLLSGPRASSAPPPPTHGTHVL